MIVVREQNHAVVSKNDGSRKHDVCRAGRSNRGADNGHGKDATALIGLFSHP